MDIPADASSITIKDYAINTVANEGIEAGDMGSTAGVADNNFEGFKHFVTNNQLNLIANTSMENVSIHNLLGQQVFTEKLSSTNEVINLSGLQAGVYITAVTINGTTKSVKIVKN
ncbi:T9SS type A sorting domain-containing protein [Aequorivita sp. Q41]|uniref:T9SS type A sorting domain-containing protein n=1 Tax=Aequorivita sp. Q41 TaxID=3153300 RepID=UPI0032420074